MAIAAWRHDLSSLLDQASYDSALRPFVERLEAIRHRIETECPEAVFWAVAYGRSLQLFRGKRAKHRSIPRYGVEILAVTTLASVYDAHVLLGEKVFGPVLLEYGKLTNCHIWTREELEAAATNGNEIWREALEEGVLLYGESNSPFKPE